MSFFVLATIVSSSISHGPSQFRTAVMSIMSGLDAEIGAAAASDSRAPEILPETNIGFKVILFPSRLLQLTSFLFLSLCNLLITFFCDAVVQSKCLTSDEEIILCAIFVVGGAGGGRGDDLIHLCWIGDRCCIQLLKKSGWKEGTGLGASEQVWILTSSFLTFHCAV
jgi:hypothetical protein